MQIFLGRYLSMHASHGIAENKAVLDILFKLSVRIDVFAVAKVHQVGDEFVVVGVNYLVSVFMSEVSVGGGGEHVAEIDGGTTSAHNLEVNRLHVQWAPILVVPEDSSSSSS